MEDIVRILSILFTPKLHLNQHRSSSHVVLKQFTGWSPRRSDQALHPYRPPHPRRVRCRRHSSDPWSSFQSSAVRQHRRMLETEACPLSLSPVWPTDRPTPGRQPRRHIVERTMLRELRLVRRLQTGRPLHLPPQAIAAAPPDAPTATLHATWHQRPVISGLEELIILP